MKSIKSIFFALFALVFVAKMEAQTDTNLVFKYQEEFFTALKNFNIPILQNQNIGYCYDEGVLSFVRERRTEDTVWSIPPQIDPDSLPVLYVYDTIPRNVYWIHGLNGSVTSWALAALATSSPNYATPEFPNRYINSVRGPASGPTYGENVGISAASFDMNSVANVYVNSDSTHKDFIIAHSQGGIVSREWLRNMEEFQNSFPDYAHGLVTFGSPHTGAQVLNNTRPDMGNMLPAFFGEACKVLANAEVAPLIHNSFLTRLLLSNTIRNSIGAGCNILSESIIPYAMSNYYKPTTKDYYVGSPFMTSPKNNHPTGLMDYTLKVPVVQFYGVEESPVIWKFFSSVMEMGESWIDSSERLFAYDADSLIEIKVNKMRDEFIAKRQITEAHRDGLRKTPCWGFVLGGFAIGAPIVGVAGAAVCYSYVALKNKEYSNSITAYKLATNWINDAPDYYLEIIGAREEVLVPFTINIFGRGLTLYKTEVIYKDNDGMVLAESAGAGLNVQNGLDHSIIKMEKTNHEQMKNSRETQRVLNKLYNGEYIRFFKTNIRY